LIDPTNDLVTFLTSFSPEEAASSYAPFNWTKKVKTYPSPVVNLCFDEVQTLLTVQGSVTDGEWTAFDTLQAALQKLQELPVFSLFLSTSEDISWATTTLPASPDAPGWQCLDPNFVPPFTNLGFDTLAEVISLDGQWNLDKLTEDAHISQLGRPLSVSHLLLILPTLIVLRQIRSSISFRRRAFKKRAHRVCSREAHQRSARH